MTNKQSFILLVDDDPSNLNMLVDQLLEQDFGLLVAKSGESALERVRMHPPDIILLDVCMPSGIDGFETCRRLKANPDTHDIPVIFLTALADADDRELGLRVGGVDYITKPIEITEVLLRIRTHLTLRRLCLDLEDSNRSLNELNDALEGRVLTRTAQLTAEIERRKQSESQQARLLEIVRTQGTQLQIITKRVLTMQVRQRAEIGAELSEKVASELTLVEQRLAHLWPRIDNAEHTREIGFMIRQLAQVQTVIDQMLSDLQNSSPEETTFEANPLLKLSDREREVLLMITKHYSNEYMASTLHVTEQTIRTYRYRIAQKLDATNEDELLELAMRYFS